MKAEDRTWRLQKGVWNVFSFTMEEHLELVERVTRFLSDILADKGLGCDIAER